MTNLLLSKELSHVTESGPWRAAVLRGCARGIDLQCVIVCVGGKCSAANQISVQ